MGAEIGRHGCDGLSDGERGVVDRLGEFCWGASLVIGGVEVDDSVEVKRER